MKGLALALSLAASLAADRRPARPPEVRGRDGGTEAARPDAGARPPDPDQELIDNLDEIENLELLQNLELFDPKGGDRDQGDGAN